MTIKQKIDSDDTYLNQDDLDENGLDPVDLAQRKSNKTDSDQTETDYSNKGKKLT